MFAPRGNPQCFRLPIHLYNLLAKIAAEEGVRPSVVAERVVIEWLEERNPRIKGGTPKPFMGKFDATKILESTDGQT